MTLLPHVTQNTSRKRSATPDAFAASVGYQIWQPKRMITEQGFGCAKMVGRMRQVMARSLTKVDQMFVRMMSAHNLTRPRILRAVCAKAET